MLFAVRIMLDLQDRMNTKVHPEWREQGFEWYRAAWIECAELMDHAGYKWWKHADPDLEQIQLEVVDIWHFGMSALLAQGSDIDTLAREISTDLDEEPREAVASLLEATEALAEVCLTTQSFSTPAFLNLMRASGLSFDQLYRMYVGKNVLNFFRQDHGYKEGSYVKVWGGREDNEHLSDLLATMDVADDDFAESLYKGLVALYPG
jgi:dimeric dUTPase (all-alpha-NTP-PPase superfamily)